FVETGPAVIEIRRRIENLARRGAIHDVDADRLLDITIEMEKADREIAGSLRPKAIFRLELDLLVEVETDRLDELGRWRRLGPVRLCRRRLRAGAQSVVAKRFWLTEFQIGESAAGIGRRRRRGGRRRSESSPAAERAGAEGQSCG